MRTRLTVSPTAITTWRECPRKLAWRDSGIFTAESPSAKLGTEVHAALEQWRLHGVTGSGKAWEIAAQGIENLPPKTPCERVELEVARNALDVCFSMRIDIAQPSVPLVIDHKTTGDFKWAKSAKDLKTDVQACLYAWAVSPPDGEDVPITLLWNYYGTRMQGSRPVVSVVRKADYMPVVAASVDTGREILTAINGCDDPLQYPYNPRACRMYGGCPCQANCSLKPEEMFSQMESSKMADFLAKVNAAKGVQATQPAAPAALPPAAPAALPSKRDALLAKFGINTGVTQSAPPPAAPPPPPPPPAPAPAPAAKAPSALDKLRGLAAPAPAPEPPPVAVPAPAPVAVPAPAPVAVPAPAPVAIESLTVVDHAEMREEFVPIIVNLGAAMHSLATSHCKLVDAIADFAKLLKRTK